MFIVALLVCVIESAFHDAFALYHTYFQKTLTREFWSTERVLSPELKTVN